MPPDATVQRAPLDESATYRDAYQAMRPGPLRDRLHSLAHDPRIPNGIMRAWALQLMRWRAGDTDRYGNAIVLTAPPSASVRLDTILDVQRLVERELVPDFRAPRWRELRDSEGQAA